ncbi:hypothetical protein [Vreelandella sp. TE19]
MKKLTATAAIALALVSGSALAERGSAELNAISQPASSATHQAETRSASMDQVIAKNSASGEHVTPAASSSSDADQSASLDQVLARNGSTGEQTDKAASRARTHS